MATKIRDENGNTRFWIAVTNYRCEFAHPMARKGETCPGKQRHQVKESARTKKLVRKAQTALDDRRDKARDLPGQRPDVLPEAKPGTLTVAAYVETWLAGVAVTQAKGKRGALRAETTIDRYSTLLKHVTREVGTLPLDQLNEARIERVYASIRERGLSDKTTLNVHRALKHALKDATRKRLIHENPAGLIDAPGAATYRPHPPTPEQTRAIIDAAKDTQLGAIVAVAAWTGARQGELIALTWDDVDLNAPCIFIGKSKTESGRRRIPLTPGTVATLREYRAWQDDQRVQLGPVWTDSGRVFTTRAGKPIDDSTLRREWQTIRDRAGVTCRFHDLRHGFATFLLSQGIHPKIVSSILGHSRIAITLDTYSHLIPALGLEAEAIAALDRTLGGTA
jgi:integrase